MATTTAAPVMSLFMSSIDALGFKLSPPESNVTPLPTRHSGGCVTSVPVIEDDETRWLVRARGHAEQPAESLVPDPRLVPDLDGEPGVAGDNADAIGELLSAIFPRVECSPGREPG